jgi:hypothetical protein
LRLLRARLMAPAGSALPGKEVGALDAQPPPRVLEVAASKVAEATAFGHPGGGARREALLRLRDPLRHGYYHYYYYYYYY